MNNNQVREKIQNIIAELSDEKLPFILNYLENYEKASLEKATDVQLLNKIFEEDAELLKRLAQ